MRNEDAKQLSRGLRTKFVNQLDDRLWKPLGHRTGLQA